MRLFPHSLFVLLLAVIGCSAQDKKDADKKAEKPKLGIGDPAPAITSATWVKGPETKFEKGKVYVVEFWATWCGPCIKAMPHLTALLEEYKDKGLSVVAVTTKDDNGNTEEEVRKFVEKRGARVPFPFAFCTTDATSNAFMEASGTDGIPASFVIDQNGKVAFIGSPGELDDVLPRVLAGTWEGQKSVDEIQKEKDALDVLLMKVNYAAEEAEKANKGKEKDVVMKAVMDAAAVAAAGVLAEFPAYEKKYPLQAKQTMVQGVKLMVALQARKFDDAATISDGIVARGAAKKDTHALGRVRSIWLMKSLNPDRKSIGQSVKAVEEVLKIEGEEEIGTLLAAAETYYAAGDAAKGKAYGDKALKAAEGDGRTKEEVEKTKQAIEKALKEYQK